MSAHNTDGHLPVSPRPNLTVVPHAEEGVPAARLRRNLNRMTRGRRVSRRHTLRVLVIEHVLIGRQRHASSTSYAENLTRGLGKAAGDHVLGKTHRTLDGLASKADSIRGEQAMLRTRAGYRRGDFVAHPNGGVRTVTETVEDQDSQRAKIIAAIDAGSYRHRRLSEALHRVPVIVFICDALLLLYFFSGVTNVDWTSPLSAALTFAVILAAMVTLHQLRVLPPGGGPAAALQGRRRHGPAPRPRRRHHGDRRTVAGHHRGPGDADVLQNARRGPRCPRVIGRL